MNEQIMRIIYKYRDKKILDAINKEITALGNERIDVRRAAEIIINCINNSERTNKALKEIRQIDKVFAVNVDNMNYFLMAPSKKICNLAQYINYFKND